MSLAEAAAAFRQGLRELTATAEDPAPQPDDPLAEARRLYTWQIRDLTRRLTSCTDPADATRLHARITDARAKLDAATIAAARNGSDITQHPQFVEAVGRYIEMVQALLASPADVGLLVADLPPEAVARVLAAAATRLEERMASLAAPAVNALDATR